MSDKITRREFLKVSAGVTTSLLLSGMVRELDTIANDETNPVQKKIKRSFNKKPNVLLIIMDTVRAKSMSLYGYEKPTTPELEKLSLSGTLFRTAISPSSWTLPGHASIFTGQWPNRLSTHFIYPLDKTYPVLAEVMSAQGYITAGFVANTVYCSREFGLSRGFDHYEDYRLSAGQMLMSEVLINNALKKAHLYEALATNENFGRKSAEMVNRDFLKWLKKQKTDRPFFAFLNYFDAHDPYLPPIEIARLYGLKRPYGHENAYIFKNLPPEALKELNLAYEATIQYMDQQIGNLIENLTSQNILDDTLVIITADHGEFFGEHGMLNHANGLYMELIHVPMLLIHSQKVPKGQILDTPVSLRNIPATILDFIGISNQAIFPGHNLARFWQEDTVTEEVPYSHTTIEDSKTSIYHNWLESIVYQDLHYIRPEQQDEELYDIKNDSGELHNLAADPDYKETLLQYQAYLKDIHSSP